MKISRTTCSVNGKSHEISADARVTLLDYLRDIAGLPGSKKGCNQGACGACTVLIDGERVLSCLTLVAQCSGRAVTTIEGIGSSNEMHPLQSAFVEHDGFQCGFCTPGQICSAVGMVDEVRQGVPSAATSINPADGIDFTNAEIRERMSGNLCRCGAYNGIVNAVRETFEKEFTR
jgi:xanthine dehydrogenase YagT iron-sulfur-binding subunit